MAKPRILFVDDEPQALRGLQRVLHGRRGQWDMSFVLSAAEATVVLDSCPVDVIITDMRMPGTDGAALLEQVRNNHPGVIRMVLSGQAGQEASLRAAAVAHQYLSKPCDASVLLERVESALRSRALVANPALQQVVARLDRLPSLPSLYFELLNELAASDPSIERIGAIIERDVSMTAKILQLVNSAFFSLRAHVSSPERAIQLLGLDAVRSLVLTAHVFGTFRPTCEAFDAPELWRHCGATAQTAVGLLSDLQAGPEDRGDAFAAGLLHDVGKLALATGWPIEYAEVLVEAHAHQLPDHIVEQRRLGCSHAELGAYLLGLWGVPASIVTAVWRHHAPQDAGDGRTPLLTAIHVADALEHERSGDGPPRLDMAYLAGFGADILVPAWRGTFGPRALPAPRVAHA